MCLLLRCQRQQVPEMEQLHHRTYPLVKSPPQAGLPSASPTKSSGRCTSSSRPPFWRSVSSSSCARFGCARSDRERHLPSAPFHRYNVVFRYLLSVRRVQSQLQHCWALQMQRKHLKSTQTDAVKWRLRNHMAFLIDNLQYYLQVRTLLPHGPTLRLRWPRTARRLRGLAAVCAQVDVLESQFSQLLQQINSTRDFESIRLAHDHFLSNLLAQSFILLKPVCGRPT